MKIIIRIAIGLGLTCLVLAVAALASPTQLAAQGLPPRPTLTPQPTPTAASSAQTEGALIELYVPTRQMTLWTVVEWQDSLGGWHTVEGWQGILDEINSADMGRKVWWVSRAEMGKGPFRWQVYQSQNGPLLVTSRLFDLPHYNGEIVRIQVTLEP